MRYDILTIFPGFFESPLSTGILKKAVEKGLIEINTIDIRAYSEDKHRKVDDKPYGGGGGMVLEPGPLGRAIEHVTDRTKKSLVILTTPQGERLSDKIAKELSHCDRLIIICGRYEGIDERIRDRYVDREISIGDYVLSGGEYAASIIVDSVSRYIPGVLGNESSPYDDSFAQGLLEHPHYTRPETYKGIGVPEVLLSGNHREIEKWKRYESIKRTFLRKPELLDRAALTPDEFGVIKQFKRENSAPPRLYIALLHYPVYNKESKIITTAFTNLDVHDIARAAMTYGVRGFFLAHPVKEQRDLVQRVLRHWLAGSGSDYNPSRREALGLVSVKSSLDEVVCDIEKREGKRAKIIVTDARPRDSMTGYGELRERISARDDPYLIVFGTGWGIAKEVTQMADYVLKPVWGAGDYNHLSVRSAAAIILDRLVSR